MIASPCLVIGAQVIFQSARLTFLSNDGANHRIALISTPELSDDPDKETHAAAHRAGLSFQEIHRRAYAGEYLPQPPLGGAV